jgi:hypothetical protein
MAIRLARISRSIKRLSFAVYVAWEAISTRALLGHVSVPEIGSGAARTRYMCGSVRMQPRRFRGGGQASHKRLNSLWFRAPVLLKFTQSLD